MVATSSKKGPKNKSKSTKQQRQSSPPPEPADNTISINPGLASLEEAVARLEASNGNTEKASTSNSKDETTPMNVDENDQFADASASKALNSNSEDHGMLNGKNRVNGGTKPLDAKSEREKARRNEKIAKEDELTKADASDVLELKMHSSEVFMCAWNPVFTDMIATGSGDASARIWQMGGAKAKDGLGPVCLLPHGTGPRDKKNKDVTTLEWSSDGKLLATGSYDGVARVWSRTGALVHTLRGHKGPIFSLKWNRRGNYLLSGSYDRTTIVWDVSGSTGFVEQQFNDHMAPALDVDWKDDTTFASCSTDKSVHICRVGKALPLKVYHGHTDEVNAVKWAPSGDLLASCSDDCTAKVWDVTSDNEKPLHDFKYHEQEIYTVKW
jgi:transducin (beta)-like 1